jgi:hypothetical protein
MLIDRLFMLPCERVKGLVKGQGAVKYETPANLTVPLIDFTVTDCLRDCMQRNHGLCQRLLVATARFARATREAISTLQLVATKCHSCQQRRFWRCEPSLL